MSSDMSCNNNESNYQNIDELNSINPIRKGTFQETKDLIEKNIQFATQEAIKAKKKKPAMLSIENAKNSDVLSPDLASPSSKTVSPSLKKMFGVLGSIGREIKKNLTVIGGLSINKVTSNLQKIQDKLNFLK